MKQTAAMPLKPLNKLCGGVSIELCILLTALHLATRRRLGRSIRDKEEGQDSSGSKPHESGKNKAYDDASKFSGIDVI